MNTQEVEPKVLETGGKLVGFAGRYFGHEDSISTPCPLLTTTRNGVRFFFTSARPRVSSDELRLVPNKLVLGNFTLLETPGLFVGEGEIVALFGKRFKQNLQVLGIQVPEPITEVDNGASLGILNADYFDKYYQELGEGSLEIFNLELEKLKFGVLSEKLTASRDVIGTNAALSDEQRGLALLAYLIHEGPVDHNRLLKTLSTVSSHLEITPEQLFQICLEQYRKIQGETPDNEFESWVKDNQDKISERIRKEIT